MPSTTSSELAARLADALKRTAPIKSLPDRLRPASLESAYAVQSAVRRLSGGPTAGYKVGLTSRPAQLSFGADGPVFGQLGAQNLMQSPAILRSSGLPRFAEAEIIFMIGGRLEPDEAPFCDSDVSACISEAFVGIEICSTRYAWDEVSLPELVADNCNADSIVIGDRLRNWNTIDLGRLPVALCREGHADVEGSTSAVLGNPIKAVTWLANQLASRGERLEPGQYVASGSCTGVTALSDREVIVATFGGLGQARAEITPPDEKGNSDEHGSWTRR